MFTRVDAVNPMDQVKNFLTKANVNLTSDQEKALRPTVEAAIKQLRDINDRFAAQRGGGQPSAVGRKWHLHSDRFSGREVAQERLVRLPHALDRYHYG